LRVTRLLTRPGTLTTTSLCRRSPIWMQMVARTASIRTELHALSPKAGPGFDARCSVLFHQQDALRGLARAQWRVRGGIHQPAPGPVTAAGDAIAARARFDAPAAGDGGTASGRQHRMQLHAQTVCAYPRQGPLEGGQGGGCQGGDQRQRHAQFSQAVAAGTRCRQGWMWHAEVLRACMVRLVPAPVRRQSRQPQVADSLNLPSPACPL